MQSQQRKVTVLLSNTKGFKRLSRKRRIGVLYKHTELFSQYVRKQSIAAAIALYPLLILHAQSLRPIVQQIMEQPS